MENEEVSPENQIVEGGSEEHNALMIEKFQSQSGAPEQSAEPAPERPEGLPEKFNSWEDMAKAYAELERKQSTPAVEETPADAPLEDARHVVAEAGVDFDALSDEFLSTGGLSDDSYATLEAKGFTRDLVDSFIEGQQAKSDLFRAEALMTVGGEDAYNEMTDWAAKNLSRDELVAFNDQVSNGNLTAAKMAINGLKARFDQANGEEPDLLTGDTGSSSAEVFRSTAELTAAMRDPRYKKDAAYREDVRRKISKSNLF